MKPGDYILVENRGTITDRLIQFGQWLRRKERNSRRFVHACVVVDENGGIVEAEPRGIRSNNVSSYEGHYELFEINAPDDQRANAVKFVQDQVGKGYGFVTIISIVIQTLFRTRFTFGVEGTMICSALVARELERCGYIFMDPFMVEPADLATL